MKAIHAKKLLILASAAVLSSSFYGCGRPTNELAAQSAYGQCIPITEQYIPFTASYAQIDSMSIRAGVIPGGGGYGYSYGYSTPSIGTVTVGGAVTGGSLFRQSSQTGTAINMAYTPAQPYAYGSLPTTGYQYNSGQQATFVGYVQLTDTERQAIVAYLQRQMSNGAYGYYNGGTYMNNGYQTNVGACVSSIAFQFQTNGQQLGGGTLFLYLNNSPMTPHTIQL